MRNNRRKERQREKRKTERSRQKKLFEMAREKTENVGHRIKEKRS